MNELLIAKEVVLKLLENSDAPDYSLQNARSLINLFCQVYIDLISQSSYDT
jgi:hypothetical protein